MFFTCPVCSQKTIFFPTKMLHVWGGWQYSRSNRFECTNCHALLGSAYSPLPFFLIGAIAQVFVTQSGTLKDLWIGGLLCALVALFLFPIRQRPESELRSPFAAVRSFRNPWDQGFFYIENKLLSLLLALLAGASVLGVLQQRFPNAGAHAGGLIMLLPVGIVALLAAMLYGPLIYRMGRRSTGLRITMDASLIAGVLLWL